MYRKEDAQEQARNKKPENMQEEEVREKRMWRTKAEGMVKEETWKISLKLGGYQWVNEQGYLTSLERGLTHSTNM